MSKSVEQEAKKPVHKKTKKIQPWVRMAGRCASTGLGHQAGVVPSARLTEDQHHWEAREESSGQSPRWGC